MSTLHDLHDREERFIERCRNDFGPMTFESEMLLRYAYSQGIQDTRREAFHDGVEAQRARVLRALGAESMGYKEPLP